MIEAGRGFDSCVARDSMGDVTTTKVERAGDDQPISNPDDSTRRDALHRNISSRLLLCNVDELRVLDVLLGRLELGRHRYGHLDLAASRDWDKEEAEEHADAAIYRACNVLSKRDAG